MIYLLPLKKKLIINTRKKSKTDYSLYNDLDSYLSNFGFQSYDYEEKKLIKEIKKELIGLINKSIATHT